MVKKRIKPIQVMVSEEEKQEIELSAAGNETSTSEYCRNILLSHVRKHKMEG